MLIDQYQVPGKDQVFEFTKAGKVVIDADPAQVQPLPGAS